MNLKSLLVMTLGLTLGSTAFSQDSGEWQVQETALESVELAKSNLGAEALADSEQLVTKSGKKFRLDNTLVPQEHRVAYAQMSEAQKKSFQTVRFGLLSKMAAALNSQKLAIGFAVATKNKMVGLFKKSENLEKPTVAQLGTEVIEGILSRVNEKLWRESTKVANANEISFSVVAQAQVAVSHPKALGRVVGLGLAFGYNRQQDFLYIDVLANTEKLKSGFVFFAGVKALSGIGFNAEDTTVGKRYRPHIQSEIFFPLVLPVWDSSGKNYYSFGASTAISLPPPPFTDAFTYKNDVNLKSVVRLRVSAAFFGTVRSATSALVRAPASVVRQFQRTIHLTFVASTCEKSFATL